MTLNHTPPPNSSTKTEFSQSSSLVLSLLGPLFQCLLSPLASWLLKGPKQEFFFSAKERNAKVWEKGELKDKCQTSKLSTQLCFLPRHGLNTPPVNQKE
ncbi:hypothetical protein RJT34_12072 [Clitoria ternatea]|uniref:Uncharacterized protein n=1 Tax=Clitoria ternatea TaxID=43366 RepID=A0AAN9JN15_CLITE